MKSSQAINATDKWNRIVMDNIFHDLSKYYAANIVDNLLTIGRIVFKDGAHSFVRDDIGGSFNLDKPAPDITGMVHVIGEIHPLTALDQIFGVEVTSCFYLNENPDLGEIEVRSIHKGMATSIYTKQECPLILWNENYKEILYFDVIDIQAVFTDARLKNSFSSILAESLREYELFLPLMRFKK